jgi:hypothetical protein
VTAQRIKGQEVQILIVADGELQSTLTDIQNFNIEVELEVISKGYLGEKTERKDYRLKGIKFDGELHIHSQDLLAFVKQIISKAKRITPNVVFNITGIFSFPNGDTPELMLPDVAFGTIPVNIGSQGDYVKSKIQGECGDLDIELS